MTVAGVEVPVLAFDGNSASPELAAVERVVVVVETHKRHAATAVLEQAVLELRLGQSVLVLGRGQQPRVGEVAEGQMLVTDLGFESLVRLVKESDGRDAPSIKLHADETRRRQPVIGEQIAPLGPMPYQRGVASVADDRHTDRRPDDPKRLRHSVDPRLDVDRRPAADCIEGLLDRGGVVSLTVTESPETADIHPV